MSEKRKRPKKKASQSLTSSALTPGASPALTPSPSPASGRGEEEALSIRREEEPRRGDWNLPKPEHIPRPTAWPAGLALGITLFFWGIITSLVVLAMGLAVFIVCLYGWIGEMRHETKQA